MISISVIIEWKEKMKQLQHQLDSRDAWILKLEVQVGKLGEYNEDLSVQFREEPMAELEEDEDLHLKQESVEPTIENAKIGELSESKGQQFCRILMKKFILDEYQFYVCKDTVQLVVELCRMDRN